MTSGQVRVDATRVESTQTPPSDATLEGCKELVKTLKL